MTVPICLQTTIATLVLGLCVTNCGSSAGPATPSPSSLIGGEWRAVLAFDRSNGLAAVSSPSTWTFTGSGTDFALSIRSTDGWLPATFSGYAVLTPPAAPGTTLVVDGFYDSPRGCRASFAGRGTVANAHHIEASFHGVDCAIPTTAARTSFDGKVTLDR